MKNRWFEIVINIFFWIITAIFIATAFSIESRDIEITNGIETIRVERSSSIIYQLLICIGISAFLFYLNYLNIVRLTKYKDKQRTFLLSISLLIVLLGLQYILIYTGILHFRIHLSTGLVVGIILFYYSISVAYGLGKVWVITDKQSQLFVLEKKQSELNLLRNQLQPHFLFNALNNLLSMVDQQKSPVLAKSIDSLSSLLRFVEYETSQKNVPLRKEIDFIRNYAELQMLRFENDEIDFHLSVQGNQIDQQIEPGIFIPFIENAFKYGVELEKKSSIRIEFNLELPRQVNFLITNPIYPEIQQKKGNGSGISSTKERLRIVYPNKHFLSLSEKGGIFCVNLKIETNESNNS